MRLLEVHDFPTLRAGAVDRGEMHRLARLVCERIEPKIMAGAARLREILREGGDGVPTPEEQLEQLGLKVGSPLWTLFAKALGVGVDGRRESGRTFDPTPFRLREATTDDDTPPLLGDADDDDARFESFCAAIGLVSGDAGARLFAKPFASATSATDLCAAVGVKSGPLADAITAAYNGSDDPDAGDDVDDPGDLEESYRETARPRGGSLTIRFTDPDADQWILHEMSAPLPWLSE